VAQVSNSDVQSDVDTHVEDIIDAQKKSMEAAQNPKVNDALKRGATNYGPGPDPAPAGG
jgi:hypothetical protein